MTSDDDTEQTKTTKTTVKDCAWRKNPIHCMTTENGHDANVFLAPKSRKSAATKERSQKMDHTKN